MSPTVNPQSPRTQRIQILAAAGASGKASNHRETHLLYCSEGNHGLFLCDPCWEAGKESALIIVRAVNGQHYIYCRECGEKKCIP